MDVIREDTINSSFLVQLWCTVSVSKTSTVFLDRYVPRCIPYMSMNTNGVIVIIIIIISQPKSATRPLNRPAGDASRAPPRH